MGLDIYAGTLIRYYTHNWKAAAQQFAEANGLNFHTIRPQEQELSVEEVKEIVTQWRNNIISGLELFDGNGWWLPIDRNIMFDYVLPNYAESPLATNALLFAELKRYNTFAWNADRDTIISWSTTEGYPADAMYSRENGYEEMELREIYETESLAKFAFSILCQAKDKNNCPAIETISEYVRNPVFMQFCPEIRNTYQCNERIEYSSCSWEKGWNVKFK